jgi:hypothetical protein
VTVLTCPYSERDEDISRRTILFLEIPDLVLSSSLRIGLPNDLVLPSGFPTKTMYAFLFSSIRAPCPVPRALCPVPHHSQSAHPIIRSANDQTPHYAVFSSRWLLTLMSKYPSTPCLSWPSASARTLSMRDQVS